MSAISYELEQELAHELAQEASHEQEGENEMFFNNLAVMADRSGRSQALRKVALAAARAALRGQTAYGTGVEGEFESFGAGEMEVGAGASPAQIDATLEHMGHAAAEAESEQEAAEQFLPLIPLAAKALLPIAGKYLGKTALKIAPKIIARVTPMLTRGVANAARVLFRSPTARPLLHAIPRIARSTVVQLARRAGTGRVVNPRIAMRVLAKNTYRTLSRPRALVNAYQRSVRGNHRYRRRVGALVGRTPSPVIRPGYRTVAVGGAQSQPGHAGYPVYGHARHRVHRRHPGVTFSSPVGVAPISAPHVAASPGVPYGQVPVGVAPTSVCYCYPLTAR